MNEQIKDGGSAFPEVETTVHMSGDGESGYVPVSDVHSLGGMTLRDYAEIHFASAWAIALGASGMDDSRERRTVEANRLGRIQADEFIAAREAKS